MNQKDQKRQNQETILDLLQSQPAISQADISVRTGLQTSTVSYIVRTLKELGIVYATGKGDSGPSGGKKADLLALRPDYGAIGGIVIKNDGIISCVTDFTGRVVDRREIDTRGLSGGGILERIISAIKANREGYPNYRGTGVAVTSVVGLSGDVLKSTYFGHSIPRFVARIQEANPELALVVENDANCAAYYDHVLHRPRIRNLVHLHVPTRPFTIGAGIIIDSVLYRGATGAAGEILKESGASRVETVIERVILFVASLLDTEAIFITGEFDHTTAQRVRTMIGSLAPSTTCAIELLEDPETPILGASLQAIRVHLRQALN